MLVDYLIVGSGLTGATIARLLADAGREVLVVDRRPRVGGNVADDVHPCGIRYSVYGPHYFRTSSDRVWEFATRFSAFRPYAARCMTEADGVLTAWPLHAAFVAQQAGTGWRPAFSGRPSNFEEAALSFLPEEVYSRYVRPYNEKQWGVPASTLSAALCRRFSLRTDNDTRLTPNAKYQGLPVGGYSAWVEAMLAGIPVLLNYDYLARKYDVVARRHTVYTGPIDAYHDYAFGRLAYRGQRRVDTYLQDEAGYALPAVQVNNPAHSGGPHVRTIEWKHLLDAAHSSRIRGTVLTTETPYSPTDPDAYEYPFPDDANATLYAKYKSMTEAVPRLTACGRLGEFKYWDMDQAVARAAAVADRILAGEERNSVSP